MRVGAFFGRRRGCSCRPLAYPSPNRHSTQRQYQCGVGFGPSRFSCSTAETDFDWASARVRTAEELAPANPTISKITNVTCLRTFSWSDPCSETLTPHVGDMRYARPGKSVLTPY